MALFMKSSLEPHEHILKYALIHLGMRKCPDEKIDKIKNNEDNA
jgi:hypothetical protein